MTRKQTTEFLVVVLVLIYIVTCISARHSHHTEKHDAVHAEHPSEIIEKFHGSVVDTTVTTSKSRLPSYHKHHVTKPPVQEVAEEDRKSTTKSKPGSCRHVFCRTGRVCKVGSDGQPKCVCGGVGHCHGHKSVICGSDGRLYPSHCELHRVSCLSQSYIGVDHTGSHCSKNADENLDKPVASTQPILQADIEPTGSTTEKLEEAQKQPCTKREYERFKNNLIHYHCARTGNSNCASNDNKKKETVNDMFVFYDRDGSRLLNSSELDQVEHRDHLDRLSRSCHLTDFIGYSDTDADEIITLSEFYNAYGFPDGHQKNDEIKIFTTLVSIGNAVELKCGISGAEKIVWKRRSHPIDGNDEIKIFDDDSLYIGELALRHMGNYSCHDADNEYSSQTHILLVQMPPLVSVYPPSQYHSSGATVTVKCHSDGVPQPEISWIKDGLPLEQHSDRPQHYLFLHSNTTLEIKSVDAKFDSGSYHCLAKNSAGSSSQSGVVSVGTSDSSTSKYLTGDFRELEEFAVFHNSGYTVFELNHCHVEHHVSSEFSLKHLLWSYAQTIETLCPKNLSCTWGDAVSVQDKFVYVSQPKLNRIIVIEMTDRLNPIEVILTDKKPVSLKYIDHLDEVWLTCCNSSSSGDEEDDSECNSQVVMVIREASSGIQHKTVHIQAQMNEGAQIMINRIFLPDHDKNLKEKFSTGYVGQDKQMILHKLDLISLKYFGAIDLSQHQCIPIDAAFVPIGGYVFLSCNTPEEASEPPFHLVLDYLTDAVLKASDVGGGNIYLSPDSRNVIISASEGSAVSVYKITADGQLEHLFDEYTQLHLGHMTFFPSETGVGYNVFALSTTQNTILHIDLSSGKVALIEGIGDTILPSEWPWNKQHRRIVGGGTFGEHLLTSSKNSIIGIDGQQKHVQCQWQNVHGGSIIVSLPPSQL